MEIIVFGLSVSSSWGNGHATIWRSLIKGLAARRHRVVFFEKDVPYYAGHRDLREMAGLELVLYSSWDEVSQQAAARLATADVGIVTSYCPDALQAADLVVSSGIPAKVFYDLDTPVTLRAIDDGTRPDYVGPGGYADFDVVLSYTGGTALDRAMQVLGARRVVPLYGSVDPAAHSPVAATGEYRSDLSYLGTYAADRQEVLDGLFIEPARLLPACRFVIGGAQYPDNFPFTPNMAFVRHVPPPEHARFYCSARFVLNVTRQAMAAMGYCPSGRLFEAAACGAAMLSDKWDGLDAFFTPGNEIALVNNAADVVAALSMDEQDRIGLGRAARERVLDEHTCYRRSIELENIVRTLG